MKRPIGQSKTYNSDVPVSFVTYAITEISAEYERNDGFLRIGAQPVSQSPKFFIRDTFETEIQLQYYQPIQFKPWPPVKETAGRVQQI